MPNVHSRATTPIREPSPEPRTPSPEPRTPSPEPRDRSSGGPRPVAGVRQFSRPAAAQRLDADAMAQVVAMTGASRRELGPLAATSQACYEAVHHELSRRDALAMPLRALAGVRAPAAQRLAVAYQRCLDLTEGDGAARAEVEALHRELRAQHPLYNQKRQHAAAKRRPAGRFP